MKCRVFRSLLPLYVDAELDAAMSQRLARHAELCERCRRRHEREQALEGLVREELGRHMPGDEAAWERALRTALRRPATVRGQSVAPFALAAAGALGVAFSLLAHRAPNASKFASEGPRELALASAPPHADPFPLKEIETMKPVTLVGAAALVGVISAAATNVMLSAQDRAQETAEPVPADGAAWIALQARQRELEETVARLEETVASLERGALVERETRTPVRAPGQRGDTTASADQVDASLAGSGPAHTIDIEATMRDLLDPQSSEEERAELWRTIREGGAIDAIVEAFETRADGAPLDSELRADVGTAYLNKMLTEDSGPEKGRWGARGAAAFERALELDETNWSARFELAKHQYYADLPGDSIRNLERLIEQQPDRIASDEHARAYVWLGNLYMSSGDEDKALRVWSAGVTEFPSDATLRERLDAFR